MSRLSEEFKNSIKNKMMEKFKYNNIYQIPKINKNSIKYGNWRCKR